MAVKWEVRDVKEYDNYFEGEVYIDGVWNGTVQIEKGRTESNPIYLISGGYDYELLGREEEQKLAEFMRQYLD